MYATLPIPAKGEMALFDSEGHRLYVNDEERDRIIAAARKTLSPNMALYIEMLAYSGCRASEALNLYAEHIDLAASEVTFRTLKKRQPGHFRIVPLPPDFVERLAMVFDLRKLQASAKGRSTRLWTITRQRQSQITRELFDSIGLPHASAKSLRHAWAITAINKGVDLVTVSRALGHSSLDVTACYLNAVGEERRKMVLRMWD